VEISECCQTSFYVLPEFSLTIGGEKIKPDELEEKELFKQKEYIINLSVYRAKDIKKEDIEIIADNADKKYEIDYGISFNSDIYIKYKINEDLSVYVFKIKTIINVLAL
jgi:ABC-type molybdate transport system substrate-binding protein